MTATEICREIKKIEELPIAGVAVETATEMRQRVRRFYETPYDVYRLWACGLATPTAKSIDRLQILLKVFRSLHVNDGVTV